MKLEVDEFVFARGTEGFTSTGVTCVLDVPAGAGLGARAARTVQDALRDAPSGSVACGWLPFDTEREDARFVICSRAPRVARPQTRLVGEEPSCYRLAAEPTVDEWKEAVVSALDAIGSGSLTKVVLSRTVLVQADRRFDNGLVLARLADAYPGCTLFAVGQMVGASPELLVAKRGSRVVSRPLAGTARRASGAQQDERLRAGLLAEKEQSEHRHVVSWVRERLEEVCSDVHASRRPDVVALANVWHLSTEVTANGGPDALTLAALLHPTPAVCGVPSREALEFIRRAEPTSRGVYGGVVGWVDASGDGEWVYALRCAQISGARARLYAGAGIVAGSDPDVEVDETRAKLRAMLDALVSP